MIFIVVLANIWYCDSKRELYVRILLMSCHLPCLLLKQCPWFGHQPTIDIPTGYGNGNTGWEYRLPFSNLSFSYENAWGSGSLITKVRQIYLISAFSICLSWWIGIPTEAFQRHPSAVPPKSNRVRLQWQTRSHPIFHTQTKTRHTCIRTDSQMCLHKCLLGCQSFNSYHFCSSFLLVVISDIILDNNSVTQAGYSKIHFW